MPLDRCGDWAGLRQPFQSSLARWGGPPHTHHEKSSPLPTQSPRHVGNVPPSNSSPHQSPRVHSKNIWPVPPHHCPAPSPPALCSPQALAVRPVPIEGRARRGPPREAWEGGSPVCGSCHLGMRSVFSACLQTSDPWDPRADFKSWVRVSTSLALLPAPHLSSRPASQAGDGKGAGVRPVPVGFLGIFLLVGGALWGPFPAFRPEQAPALEKLWPSAGRHVPGPWSSAAALVCAAPPPPAMCQPYSKRTVTPKTQTHPRKPSPAPRPGSRLRLCSGSLLPLALQPAFPFPASFPGSGSKLAAPHLPGTKPSILQTRLILQESPERPLPQPPQGARVLPG